MAFPQIEGIQTKLDQLRRLDPQGSILFGAAGNQYKLKHLAREELLQQFEEKFQLTLPKGYREFLLHVGNGGAGPYYGLYQLEVTRFKWQKPQPGKVSVARFSSASEYSARRWGKTAEGAEIEEVSAADAAFYAGLQQKALKICTPGCQMETLLVVEGPKRGQMWTWDAALSRDMKMGFWPETFRPFHEIDEQIRQSQTSDVQCSFASRATGWKEVTVYDINPFGEQSDLDFFETLTDEGPLFLDWYERWLDVGLRYFEVTS